MNNEDIITFLAIVNTGSISKASEKLYLSQATISQRLKALEDKLGVHLITRQKGQRTIELTEQGAAFVPIAKKWMALMQETKMLKTMQSNTLLSIGCSDSLCTHLYSNFFQDLIASVSGIDIKLRIKDSDVIYNMVENYELDVGLILHTANNRNVATIPLSSEKMVVIKYGPDSIFKTCISTEELNPQNEIRMWWGRQYQLWHENYFDPSIRSGISVNTLSLMSSVIKKKGTWSIVPFSVAKSLQMQDEFQIYDLVPPPPNRITYKVVHKNPKPESKKVLALFDQHLEQFIRQNDWIIRI